MSDQQKTGQTAAATPSVSVSCAGGCGFYGNPRTANYCSKCWKARSTAPASPSVGPVASPTMSVTPPPERKVTSVAASPPSSPALTPIATPTPTPTPTPAFSATSTSATTPISPALAPSSPPATVTITAIPSVSASASGVSASPSVTPSVAGRSPAFLPLPGPSVPLPTFGLGSSSSSSSASPSPSASPSASPVLSAARAPGSPSVSPLSSPPSSPSLGPSASPDEKKKKNRCHVCSTKLGINYFNCRCSEVHLFCSAHRHPFSHSCPFDHKSRQRALLETHNPTVKGDKLGDRV